MSELSPVDFSENYRAAWANYRRLLRLCFLLWLGGVPVLWAIAYPLSLVASRLAQYVFGALAIVWVLAWIYVAASLQTWNCPRCRDRFSATWWYSKSIFATKCVHCGLRKFEVPSVENQEWPPR